METKILTPETISAFILSQKELHPCTINIQLLKGTAELDLFQYCLTLFMECICCYTDDFRNMDIKEIDEKTLTSFKPYLHTAGIILKVNEYKKSETNYYDNYYCRIMLKKIEEGYFVIKNIPKNYHFTRGPKYVGIDENLLKLNDLYAIFCISDRVYKLSFSICDHTTHQPSNSSAQ